MRMDSIKIKLIPLLILFLSLSGCGRGYKTPQDAVKASIGNSVVILCMENIKPDSQFVIYRSRDNKSFGCSLIVKRLGSWYLSGGNSTLKQKLPEDKVMTWAHQNLNTFPKGTVHVSYGIIIDRRISRVELIEDDSSIIKANVAGTAGGEKFWYAMRKKEKVPAAIRGIALNGQLLYYYPPKN
jgi:hypothetical protein